LVQGLASRDEAWEGAISSSFFPVGFLANSRFCASDRDGLTAGFVDRIPCAFLPQKPGFTLHYIHKFPGEKWVFCPHVSPGFHSYP